MATQSSRRPSCHWEDSFRKFDTGCSFILTSTPPFQMPYALQASMPVGGRRNYSIAGNIVPIYCRDEYIHTIWRRVYRAIWKDYEENTIQSPCVVPVPEFRVDRGSHVASYDRAMKASFFSLRITTRRYLWPSRPGVILSTLELKSARNRARQSIFRVLRSMLIISSCAL